MPPVDDDEKKEIMKLKELLVALLLLLPVGEELLIRTPDSQTDYERVHQYLSPTKKEAKGKLGKAVSQTQIDALLYRIGIFCTRNGKECFQKEKFIQIIHATTECAIQVEVESEKLGSAKPGSSSETIHILTITSVKKGYAADASIYSSARSMLEKAARIYDKRNSPSTETTSERRSKRRRFVSPTPAAPSQNTNADPPHADPANAAPTTPVGGELLYDSDTHVADADDAAATVDDAADELSSKLQEAEELDFSVEERYLPNGMPIEKCDLSYDSQQMIAEITFTCFSHFSYDTSLPIKQKDRIVSAAKRLVGYRNGLDKPRQIKSYRTLRERVENYHLFVTGSSSLKAAPIFAKKERKKRKNKIERIMEEDNEILFKAYRHCTRNIGLKASYPRIAKQMTRYLQRNFNFDEDEILTKHDVSYFFKMTKTKFKRECFKPKLTEEHKTQRVSWCMRMIENIGLGNFFTCFLDEKWFYPTSRRNVEKHVPVQEFEDEDDVYVPAPTTRSRRFVSKVMYLGVIARPVKGLLAWLGKVKRKGQKKRDGTYSDWSNGKIFLRRVSKMKKAKKTSYSQKLHTLGEVNDLLKGGAWKELYVDGMTVGELLDVIVNFYDINDEVADRLCFRYETIARKNKKTCDLSYEEEDTKLEDLQMREMQGTTVTGRELTIQDLDLFVRTKKGDEVEVDCSCDSTFMLSVMRDVGVSVCNYFFWIPRNKNGRLLLTVYLIIDNAGGHGTNEAIQEYRSMLKEEFNIVLLAQVPRSPETNLLDLGVWRSMQSYVETLSYRRLQSVEAIAEATEKAWDEFPAEKIEKVYKRWLLVLKLILKDKGGNRYVETHRGKLTSDPLKEDSNLNVGKELIGENGEEVQEIMDLSNDEDFMMYLPLSVDDHESYGDEHLNAFMADCFGDNDMEVEDELEDVEDVDVGRDSESESEDDGVHEEEECSMWWSGDNDVALLGSFDEGFDSDDEE